MGMFYFTVENSTLASRPWKYGMDYWCSFELYPEWKGNRFYVFKGVAHHQRDYMTQTDVVVKTFRHVDATSDDWSLYIEACTIGRRLAQKFNTHLSKNGSKNTIKFVTPTDVVMDNISDVMRLTRVLLRFKKTFSEDEIVIFEDFLDGDFKTFVTQDGSACEIGSEVLACFCHFTYHQSDGTFLFSSLKGTRDQDQFHLTCPVIHSPSRKFGTEDKGMSGILEFFKNHTCTGFCKDFLTPEIVHPSAPVFVESSESTDSKETLASAIETNLSSDMSISEKVSGPPGYESVDPLGLPSYDESCMQSGVRHRVGSSTSASNS